jgi:YidC/Oxa1 family membrane protein insertase
MGFIGTIWNTLLYQPLLNILVLLYHYIPGKSFGVAILVLTILTRIILQPLTAKTKQYQAAMKKLQPEIEKLRAKYKDNREKLAQETMKLYSEHKANPLMGCLPILLQLPFTFALWQVLRNGLNPANLDTINSFLYPFVTKLGEFNHAFLWFDLTKPDPYFILPVLVALLQYVQTRASQVSMSGDMGAAAKQTMMFMPLLMGFITMSFPAGLGFYFLLSVIFGIVQQVGIKEVIASFGSREQQEAASASAGKPQPVKQIKSHTSKKK